MTEPTNTRPIPGFPNYSITREGRIYSHSCIRHTGMWLKPQTDQSGYTIARFQKGGGQHRRSISQLLLQTFVGPRPKGMVCMYIDGDRTNDKLLNLKWATPAQVAQGTVTRGTRYQPDNRGERQGCSKLTEEDVQEIRFLYRTGRYSQRTLADIFGVTQPAISRVLNRQTWQCVSI